MQPNYSRQIQSRERPLQMSMFLPEQSNSSQNQQQRPSNLEFAHHPLKRSVIQGESSHRTSSKNIGYGQMGQSNYGNAIGDKRGINQSELTHHQSYTNIKAPLNYAKNEKINQKMQSMKSMEKPQKYSLADPKSGSIKPQQQQLIKKIVSQIKEKHLPMLLMNLKEEFYSDLHALRVQMNTIKQQLKGQYSKQENMYNDIKAQVGNSIINYHNNSIGNINHISSNKGKESSDVSELETHYFLLENKINQMESKMSDNFKKFFSEFDKVKTDFKDKNLRTGYIKSKLPPIMLEYKQIFVVKNQSKKNLNEQILFSSCLYYIDKYGFLLDNQNRYITDQKGNQIRLDEKQIRLLQNNNILHK